LCTLFSNEKDVLEVVLFLDSVSAQVLARKHPNTARCLGRSSIAIAAIWIALIILAAVLYFGIFVGFSAQFADVFRSMANNGTLSAEEEVRYNRIRSTENVCRTTVNNPIAH
jgi:hypothetical protein